MLPITVTRRSSARPGDSIYISSYICMPVSLSGTLNLTVNVDDSLLLPVTFTLPKMSGLISPSQSAGSPWVISFYQTIFRQRRAEILMFESPPPPSFHPLHIYKMK